MFCRYCGKHIAADSIFCANCGKQLNDSKSTQKVFIKCKPQSEVKYMHSLSFVYTADRRYRIPSEEEIYPLVAISDFLISHGFTSCRTSTADGFSEISHTGDEPYDVIYHDLDNFRNHFVEDFFACRNKNVSNLEGGYPP